jgi:hypothetical protein
LRDPAIGPVVTFGVAKSDSARGLFIGILRYLLVFVRALKRNDFSRLNRHFALAHCLSMIFSDLPSPAEAGFAKAGNRLPLFGIML